ncbi:MAG: hypothetical protein Q8L86_13945 [Vicinamibacterales bacterium]|nr:hypothetical protein [Vicinamibacterales bacterium]
MPTRHLRLPGLLALVPVLLAGAAGLGARADDIVVRLEPAPRLALPGVADSNSPVVWQLVNGQWVVHVFTSAYGKPSIATGPALDRLSAARAITYTGTPPAGGVWIEAVVVDDAGVWFGYYHNEVVDPACGPDKVVPRIGAMRSGDRGRTWRDLGIVIEGPPGSVRCETANHYFLGGVGDFSVALDASKQFLYFFYTQYFEAGGIGVATARMTWANRTAPRGRVTIWNNGVWLPARSVRTTNDAGASVTTWTYPAASPVLPAVDTWDDGRGGVSVLWGPSMHWNVDVGRWVMLLNRAVDSAWTPGGVYVSFLDDLTQPSRLTVPQPIAPGTLWYPQVIGLEPNVGTDRLAGATARFFVGGVSEALIRFEQP